VYLSCEFAHSRMDGKMRQIRTAPWSAASELRAQRDTKQIVNRIRQLGGLVELPQLERDPWLKSMSRRSLGRRLQRLVARKKLVEFSPEVQIYQCETCAILRTCNTKISRDAWRRKRRIYLVPPSADEFVRALEPWLSPIVEYLRAASALLLTDTAISQEETMTNGMPEKTVLAVKEDLIVWPGIGGTT